MSRPPTPEPKPSKPSDAKSARSSRPRPFLPRHRHRHPSQGLLCSLPRTPVIQTPPAITAHVNSTFPSLACCRVGGRHAARSSAEPSIITTPRRRILGRFGRGWGWESDEGRRVRGGCDRRCGFQGGREGGRAAARFGPI